MAKTDSVGNLIWETAFGNKSTYFADLLTLKNNDGFIIMGITGNGTIIYRTNLIGDTLWVRDLGLTISGCSLKQLYDNTFILGGNLSPNTSIVKLDTFGLIVWQKSYPQSNLKEDCRSIDEIPNRGFVMAGESDTPNVVFSVSGFIRILNYSGDIINQKYYNPGNDDDYFNSVSNTIDGGFILAGTTTNRQQQSKMYVVKTDSIGYSQPVHIQNSFQNSHKGFNLLQNYPNPFNSSTIINYEIQNKSNINLYLYDAVGRLISILVNSKKDQGIYQFILNGDDLKLSSGIYFINLSSDNEIKFSLTKSIVYIK